MAGKFLFITLMVVFLIPGCSAFDRDFGGKARRVSASMDDRAATQRPSANLLQMADPNSPQVHQLTIRELDTLALLALWSGQPESTLLSQNPECKEGLTVGQAFVISLTPEQYLDFNFKRDGHYKRKGSYPFGKLVRYERYTIQEGETIRDILAKYSTSLDALRYENGDFKELPKPGTVVKVPILELPE